MAVILNQKSSIVNQLIGELRKASVHPNRTEFRFNMERLGEIFAYEISKTLTYKEIEIETPFGQANELQLAEQPVLGTIIRAGFPLYQGILRIFDRAESAFFATYRKTHKNHDFQIRTEYLSAPDLTDKTIILSDAMIASGKSMVLTCKEITQRWKIDTLHLVAAVACEEGVEYIKAFFPDAHVWTGAMDKELTSKSYIVPGLGDAGDLAYGNKYEQLF